MNGIKEIARDVDEGAEVHDLPPDSPDVLDGYHPAYHSDGLPEMMNEVPGHHFSPEICLQHVEEADTDRKSQQLNLIEGIFEWGVFQYRHLEGPAFRLKHADCFHPDGYLLQVKL